MSDWTKIEIQAGARNCKFEREHDDDDGDVETLKIEFAKKCNRHQEKSDQDQGCEY